MTKKKEKDWGIWIVLGILALILLISLFVGKFLGKTKDLNALTPHLVFDTYADGKN